MSAFTYDFITCKRLKTPPPSHAFDYQTKDLKCNGSSYILNPDGLFILYGRHGTENYYEKVKITQDLTFYTYTTQSQSAGNAFHKVYFKAYIYKGDLKLLFQVHPPTYSINAYKKQKLIKIHKYI